MDIVWAGDRLVVAGPATGPVLTKLPAGSPAFGVRFRVGAAGAALGLPAAELLDATVPLADVWADAAEVTRPPARGPAWRCSPRCSARIDPGARPRCPRRRDRATRLGDRQLRRRFADAVGYGPKTLERILRFQRFLALARTTARNLAALALEAGYADQAHLTRECTRLSGLPPAALLASGAGPAGERSDSFKTDGPSLATLAA